MCAGTPRFWARVGAAIDPDCVEAEPAKLIVQVCRLVARDLGHGPPSVLLVVQRLARLRSEGKITSEQLAAVSDYLDAAQDEGLPPEDAAVAELAPVLRRRMQQSALMKATDEFARQGGMREVREMLDKAERIGSSAVLGGTRVSQAGFAEIDALAGMVRMPTGILELDLLMQDGMARGQLGVVLGDSGGGKSQFLVSQVAEAMRRGLFVGLLTLELPKPMQLARVYANLTGIPTNLVLENVQDRAEARRRIGLMEADLGVCVIEDMPPHATTVQDVLAWVEHQEQEIGVRMDCLVVDYADKLHWPGNKSDNEYLAMRYVYEGLRRDIAVGRNMWVWTASQASRPTKESGKRLDLHHAADSMHKVRVADVIITLNPQEDGAQMVYWVAKNRTGRSRFQVGPIPTDWERARSSPVTREWADWSVV